MAFTLRQIAVFAEAAKDENFRKTGDRLNISQPSISKHIRALEREAGGRLFIRDRGSAARLSPLGKEMLAEAKALLRTAGKVRVNGQQDEESEVTLRIAAGAYLLDRWFRPHLRRMLALENMPNVEFIETKDSDHLLQLLRSEAADCGFYTGDLIDSPEFDVTVLREASVGLYAAPDLAGRVKSIPEDFADFPFVLSNRDMKAEEWQRTTLAKASITAIKVVARTQFMDVMFDLTVDGRGAALLFDDDAKPLVDAGRLVRFPIELPSGSRCLVTSVASPRDPRKDHAIDAFSELLATKSS